jgi:ABC-type transport system involved in multi-copper enzyme maturation permease subunit
VIDALRYEFVRLRTIRSTYWLIGIALIFQLAMTMLIGSRVPSSGPLSGGDEAFAILVTIGASTGIAPLFIAYIIGLIGVFSMGHEYRHGMIRATLTAMPSRPVVLAAKVLVVAAISALAALACVLIALLSVWMFDVGMPTATGFREITLGTLIFTALFSISGLALSAITRNQTAAVALMLLLPTVIEAIIKAIILSIKATSDDPRGQEGLVELVKFLPYDAGGQMYTRLSVGDMLEIFGVVPFGPLGGGLVMGTFVAILLAISAALFLRRDA